MQWEIICMEKYNELPHLHFPFNYNMILNLAPNQLSSNIQLFRQWPMEQLHCGVSLGYFYTQGNGSMVFLRIALILETVPVTATKSLSHTGHSVQFGYLIILERHTLIELAVFCQPWGSRICFNFIKNVNELK